MPGETQQDHSREGERENAEAWGFAFIVVKGEGGGAKVLQLTLCRLIYF